MVDKNEINQITTKRLLIRPIRQGDARDIHEYAGDKGITMMIFLPNETMEETIGFVEHAVSEWEKDNPEDREYVIMFEDKIVGGISLECSDERTAYEIGWTIHKAYRNRGFATEAAQALVAHAFDNLSIQKVIAQCDVRNAASENVMKKLHMRLTDDSGTRYYPKTGVSAGELLYEITSEEYRNDYGENITQ